MAPEDIAKTIYFSMGIEDLKAVDREGKPFQLLADGAALKRLFWESKGVAAYDRNILVQV